MRKKLLSFTIFLFCAFSLMAQSPEKFTYQAVVRNANNVLVADMHVRARVCIKQGSDSGEDVYSETHVAHTNANGLLSFNIGDGTVLFGDFSTIQWSNGLFFLEVAVDPHGGNDYTIVNTQQLLSVPYALYAQKAGNGFSGSYNDLTDLPVIPEVPTNVSAFTNDAGYVTMAEVQHLFDSLNDRIDILENIIYELHDTTSVQSCPGMTFPLTDYDGNVYSTVLIGTQCWMKENLRSSHYSDGTAISQGVAVSQTTPYRYRPDNNSMNVATHGYLYNWRAVMRNSPSSNSIPSGVQGVCPTGWHVPSEAEWVQLTDYLSSNSQYFCENDSANIAKSLACTSGWQSNIYSCSVGENQSTNNASGFSARPSGYYTGPYNGFGSAAFFWTTTDEPQTAKAWYFSLFYGLPTVGHDSNNKATAFSVRCLRN